MYLLKVFISRFQIHKIYNKNAKHINTVKIKKHFSLPQSLEHIDYIDQGCQTCSIMSPRDVS